MNPQEIERNDTTEIGLPDLGLLNLGLTPQKAKSEVKRPRRLKLSFEKTKKWKSGFLKSKYKLSDHYEIIKTLGSGTYASVSLATENITGNKVAIKISRKENSCERLLNESNILHQLDHDCIIKPVKFIQNDLMNEAYLVMEYFEGWEIKEYVKENGPFSSDDCKKIIQQLSSCVAYLHSKGIAHRDIKPENLLIDTELNIKLIDFNISKRMKMGRDEEDRKFKSIFYTQISSPLYAAPEIKGNWIYSESVDIWGVGIIMFTCIYGCLTPESDSGKALGDINLKEIIETESTIPKEAQNLLLRLLCEDPQLRLTAEEILADEFLN